MFYPGSEPELIGGLRKADLTDHQKMLVQAILRAMHPGAYASQHAAAGGAAVLSLGRAEAVLRSRAGAQSVQDAQPNVGLAYTVIKRTLKSVEVLETAVIPVGQPIEDARDLLAEMVARGSSDLKEPSQCGVLARQLGPFIPALERIVLELFQQAWETALPAKAAERAVAEVASLAAWRGRDYECLLADVQRLLRQDPSGQGLLSVLFPVQRRIRVAAVVEGARTLTRLGQLFDADADVRQFPIGRKEPDGWGQGTAKLRNFASLQGRRPSENPREGERTAAAVLLTLCVRAPDRGVAVHTARRRIEEVLDAYVAGNRIAELRLAPEMLVYEEVSGRSRRYTSRGPAIDVARPLTSRWPGEIRECLRMTHIARSTSSPLTSAALSWAAIEAAGIRHGNDDEAPHVQLEPLVRGIPPIRSRRGPRRRRPGKLHGDKGYDYDHLRRWLRKRGIRHRIARRGIESSQRLGRHRWVVERTVSWLAGCRRLHRRYERKAEHFLAFVGIAAALICYRRLATLFRA